MICRTLSLLLTCLSGSAAPHLEPLGTRYEDFFSGRICSRYESAVISYLVRDQAPSGIVFVELPSFSRERMLYTVRRGEITFAVLRAPQEHAWYSGKPLSNIPIETTESPIPNRLYDTLCVLWHAELHKTTWPDEQVYGLDGCSYFFAGRFEHMLGDVRTSHFMSGQCWSPDESSRLGRTVEVGELLVRFLEMPEKFRVLTTEAERMRWLDRVASGTVAMREPLILEGEREYRKDPFFRDPLGYIGELAHKLEMENRANKSLEPTPTAVTPRAGARVAPAVSVAQH